MPRLLFFSLLLLCLNGCVSYWKGQEMKADIKALEGRLEQVAEAQHQRKKQLSTDLQGIIQRFITLETKVNEAISALRSNSADSGVLIEQLRQEIAGLQGKLEEASQAKAQNESGIPELPLPPGAPPLPESADDLYRFGWESKKTGDCREAIRAFSTYARKFPKKGRADNSLYLLAECLYIELDHAGSIRSLQLIMKKYPQGDKVDDALLLMHDNFIALGRCKDALPFLETLLADYPQSNRIRAARRKLKSSKKSCR